MTQLLILMLATAAGPFGTFNEGKQYLVDEERAQAWIDGGYAVRAPASDAEVASVVEAAIAAVAVVATKETNVTRLNHAQLVALADERGVDASGSNRELVERLTAPPVDPAVVIESFLDLLAPGSADDDLAFDESAAIS